MILHLVTRAVWDAQPANQPYLPAEYAKDGFIHCTQGDDVLLQVANRFYKGVAGEFLVLGIDETKVKAPIKWEAAPAPFAPAQSAPAPVATNLNPAPTTSQVPPEVPPEVDAEFGSAPAETPAPIPQAAPANAPELASAQPVLFPHIYGPLNRDAITSVRRMLREADGTFSGYASMQPDAPEQAGMNLKTPSQLANELVDATGDFSDALARYKDKIEAHMDELDKNIKRSLGSS